MRCIKKHDLPIVYFNHYSSFQGLSEAMEFMQEDNINRCFLGVNLGKIGLENFNLLIRGTYKEVYDQMKQKFENKQLPDLIIIFEKRCH